MPLNNLGAIEFLSQDPPLYALAKDMLDKETREIFHRDRKSVV